MRALRRAMRMTPSASVTVTTIGGPWGVAATGFGEGGGGGGEAQQEHSTVSKAPRTG